MLREELRIIIGSQLLLDVALVEAQLGDRALLIQALVRGDETMGLARRRLRHNPWIAAAASWRMQRFQSRYCRYVDASGRRSLPRGRLLLVSANASSKALICRRRTRQGSTASLRSILSRLLRVVLFPQRDCGPCWRSRREAEGVDERVQQAEGVHRGLPSGAPSLRRRRLAPASFAVLLAVRMGCPARAATGIRGALPSGCVGLPAARTGTTAYGFQWQCLGQTGAFARPSSATTASRVVRAMRAIHWLGRDPFVLLLASVLRAASSVF